MPVYLYQGQHYTIATDDPAEAKRKIQASLEQSTYTPPQTPVSAMPAPVEGSGGAAFGVYRPAGRRPESQQDREASKDMPLQTARGLATGTLGAIPDLINLPGAVYGAVTGEEPGYRVPGGSEDWNRILPGQSNTPQARLARFGGEMLAPIPTLKGVQAIGQGAQMAGQAVKAAGQGAVDVTRGALRGVAYPGGTAENTALLPIKPSYVPHEQVAEFMAGNRPASTLTEMPTADLINQTTGGRWAYGMAPKNAAGERLVPAQGRLMEGIGENIGAGIRTNPLQGLLDIGGLATVGTPVGSILRGVPAAATGILNKATNFEPGFVQARNAALAQEGRAGLQAGMPETPLLPAPAGPVRPTPTMYVAPDGQATTNVAGTQTNYTPPAPQSASFNQVRRELTPAETSQQAAAARIQPVAPVMSAEKQAVIDQVRARTAARTEAERVARVAALQQRAQAAGGYTPPVAEAPTAPVAPTEVPTAPTATTNTLASLRDRLTPQTPEELAAVEAYNAKTPADKAAQTRAENAAKKAETDLENEFTKPGGRKPVISADRRTLTYTGQENFENHPSSYPGELPKGFSGKSEPDWKRQNIHYDENENVIGTSWESVGSKKSPAYKFEQNFASDEPGVLYKKEAGGDWQPVQPTAQTTVKKGPPGTVSMIADEGAEVWRILKTKTQTLGDGSVVKTYPYDEAGKVKVRETQAPGAYGRMERTYSNTETGAMIGEKFAGKNDLLDRWIELPDGTEINQRFASEMRNGQSVRTNQTEVIKNKKNDIYIDGKYSHSYDGRNSLIKGPVNGKLPDIESLIKQIKGD